LFLTERAQWDFPLPGVALEACAGPVLIVIVESLEIGCDANGMFSHGRT
jgi:hypothetical protein